MSILPTEPRERATLTIGAAQRQLATVFAKAGLETPGLDARLLVTRTLGIDSAGTLKTPDRLLSPGEADLIEAVAHRRLAREPVSRILGRRQFHGLDLEVGPATLDPRPDTETLVEGVLRLAADGLVPGSPGYHIADVGTGTGAILLALLTSLPEATGLAIDIDPDALSVARRNAGRHGLAGRTRLQLASWLDGIDGRFDLIVSNPPYIESARIGRLEPEVARYDPRRALDGGLDGLDAYRALIGSAAKRLSPGGWLALEVGCDQSGKVRQFIELQADKLDPASVQIWPDLAGMPRCVAARAHC